LEETSFGGNEKRQSRPGSRTGPADVEVLHRH
jgi:hypothetical protein